MDADKAIESIASFRGYWDVVIIGGGATGLARRSTRPPVATARCFSSRATSPREPSRSTKLVHGGVRYLRQGNVSLVLRGAPRARAAGPQRQPPRAQPVVHRPDLRLVGGAVLRHRPQGLRQARGKLGIAPSESLSRAETLARIPNLEPNGLRAG